MIIKKISFIFSILLVIASLNAQINIDSVVNYASNNFDKVLNNKRDKLCSTSELLYVDNDSLVHYTINKNYETKELVSYCFPALVIYKYDSLNREVERRQYGEEGYLYSIDEPISSHYHIHHAVTKKEYNKADNLTSISFFDNDEKPINYKSKLEFVYNDKGKVLEKKIFSFEEKYFVEEINRYEYDKNDLGIYVARLDSNREFSFPGPPIKYFLHEEVDGGKRLIEEIHLDRNKNNLLLDPGSVNILNAPVKKYNYENPDSVTIKYLDYNGNLIYESSFSK